MLFGRRKGVIDVLVGDDSQRGMTVAEITKKVRPKVSPADVARDLGELEKEGYVESRHHGDESWPGGLPAGADRTIAFGRQQPKYYRALKYTDGTRLHPTARQAHRGSGRGGSLPVVG